ncbi:peptidase M20 [Kordiimonas sediminis]|uniref:Peptidase M20 n=1 Tax=Kordiimonas sediminis TaxID=1735581 RepID=A0A919AQ90_9PROT|nr:M20/M25/M40 family metallo-hydrolase [Kordiimonas sediminis]GHF20211.1 peptidase M20 [Kordiimonas sediminis]
MKFLKTTLAVSSFALFASATLQAADLSAHEKMAREIYKETVETPTSTDHPEAMFTLTGNLKNRFMEAGFAEEDITLLNVDGLGGMIVRYPGKDRSKQGIGFMAHLDVVTAKRKDWVLDPFVLTEKDGFFMGRGTADNKAGAVGLAATFIKLKKEGYVPDRDLVIIYTGDEETGMVTTKHIAANRDKLLNIELIYNSDAGGGSMDEDGKPLAYSIQAAEKTYMTLLLTVTNSGGHSSQPRDDNAIYQLIDALQKVEDYSFPPRLNPVSKIMLNVAAENETGEMKQALLDFANDPSDMVAADILSNNVRYNSITRTTCVTTMLEAGHAENALPQSAQATVNCRIMPGVDPADVEHVLASVIGDDGVVITRKAEPSFADASPLREDVIAAVKYAMAEEYGELPVSANMSAGGTDGKEFRAYGMPVYGTGGLFGRKGDRANAHGLNEKIRVDSFYKSLTHWERLMKFVSGGVQ